MSETSGVENDALPGGVFAHIRAAYEAHDKTCVSLRYMWLARRGGFSCPSDLDDCTDCGVTFYNEGVAWLNYDDPDADDEIRACGCCAVKRGIVLTDGEYGVTTVTPPTATRPEPDAARVALQAGGAGDE